MEQTMLGEALPKDHPTNPECIAATISLYRYGFSSESELHAGLKQALTEGGIPFQHEFVAGPTDRFDFLIDGGIVVEAKIKGSFAQAAAQCMRYAERDDVSAVVLVATRLWAAGDAPQMLGGKPFIVVKLAARVF